MSYCRWSSCDFWSDLYVYESDQGVEIHVASGRLPDSFFASLPPAVPCDPHDHDVFARWFERGQQVAAAVGAAADEGLNEPIGLSHDGQSYTVDPADAAGAVAALSFAGYRVPDGVVDALAADLPEATRHEPIIYGPCNLGSWHSRCTGCGFDSGPRDDADDAGDAHELHLDQVAYDEATAPEVKPFASYHPTPNPHIVMDQGTFDHIKAKSADVKPDPMTWGRNDLWHGTPVYIGSCPWDCEATA